jgi:transcription initiation factor TFIIF subunit beta
MGIGGTADAYIRTAVEKKKRTQENKATRMDEIPLIDIIVNLFKEYRFYSMATLRQKTNQPEAWLRQIMSKIGVLVKTGPAANHWMLNETYNDITQFDKQGGLKSENLENIKQEHIAPVTAEALALEKEEDMEDDEDDDDEEFEDVS